MTPRPIDTDTTSRALRAIQGGAWGPNDMDLLNRAVPALCDALEAAEHRATRAESERDEWKEVALQERGAALDALEQIKAREARIKAVRDVLGTWATYCQADQTRRVLTDIRRALEGDT